MVRKVIELFGNHSFTLITYNGKRNRLRCLKNDVPQGSVLAKLLFNIYTPYLANTASRKYAYADDLAFMHAVETGRQWKQCYAKIWQPWVRTSRPGNQSSALQK